MKNNNKKISSRFLEERCIYETQEMYCFEIKEEAYDEIDNDQYPENREDFETYLVKVEDADISEQFIDETQVYDRREYLAKNNNNRISHLSEHNYAIKFDNSLGTKSLNQKINDSEISSNLVIVGDWSPGNRENFETYLGKVKDVDISKQLLDETQVHERRAYLAENNDNSNHLSEHNYALKFDYSLRTKSANQKIKDSELPSNLVIEGDSSEPTLVQEHKCDLCDFASNCEFTFKLHVESFHSNSSKYKCKYCDFTTNVEDVYRRHEVSNHSNLVKLKCSFCDCRSCNISDLQLHLASVHLNLKKHKCRLCDYASNTKANLKSHIETIHLHLKKHRCTQCDYATAQKSNLQIHIKSIHLNLKEHKCDLCDFASNYKVSLENHIVSAHLKLKQHFFSFV